MGTIVIFGTGMQTLRHTRFILMLRREVSPSEERVGGLIATVSKKNRGRWRSGCFFHYVNFAALNAQRDIEGYLNGTDCIFCTTLSKKPLFPTSCLTKAEMMKGGRRPFILAIGSWQPDVIELNLSLLHDTIAASGGYSPNTGESKGVILIDGRSFGLESCSELVQSGIVTRDIVEFGEIIASRTGGKKYEHLIRANQFVSEGFVVYMSVGVSLTDFAVGGAILGLYKKKQKSLLN